MNRTALGLALALSVSAPALAGGFYLQEQSAVAVGRAFAGEAALARDAGTVFYNPAGMTLLERPVVQGGGVLLFIESGQSNRGTTRGVVGVGDVPVEGGDGGNPFDAVVPVPSLQGAMPVTADGRLWIGLAVSAPFGLSIEYDDGWFGRYDSLKSDLRTYNAQPSIAYRLNDVISVGAGLSVQYIEAELTNALPNVSPLQPDGFSRLEGDDISFGWNAGVLFDLTPLRVGLHYRSHISHELSGELAISGLAGPLAGGNREVQASAPITTPDIWTVSAVYDRAGWRALFSANVYNWSQFDAIRVFDEAGEQILRSEQGYRDTFGIHGGLERDLSERFTLRAGIAYDQTPTTGQLRTTRVPDGDRTWVTAGGDWRIGNGFTLSLAYAHVFVTAEAIDRTDPLFEGTPAAVEVTTRSRNRGNVDILSVAVAKRF